ncbi:MAG: Phosphatidylglycerol--prolipoprotein diacylglyceryl transferase [Dehalococcoidia bacterium]|nr:Phosphatidylglycerol--prolipoprotein diacylglyceryl transferase [Dehalococcoidia bacterium]
MDSAVLLAIKIGLDPQLFEVAGIEITWHGLFTAVGVVVGVAVAAVYGRRAGFNEDSIYNVALALVIGGIIGARSLYVIENWSQFDDDIGDIFAVNTGGISIYGALIGGTLGAWGYALVSRLPNIPRAADIAAMGGIMGMAVGRIGDVINGEHFAKSTDLPWGVSYTNPNSPSYLAFGGPDAVQHPAVAYELLGDLVIFALLVLVYTRVRRSGVTFFSWMLLYGALRLGVSFFRLDDIVWLGLRTAQLIAIASMALAVLAIIYLLRTPPQEERLSRAERRRLIREEGAEGEPSQGS